MDAGSLWPTGIGSCTARSFDRFPSIQQGDVTKHRTAVQGPAAPAPPSRIVGITTNAGVEVKFDDGAVVQGDKLTAQVGRKPYEIRQAEVQRYWVETTTFSTGKTVGLVAGIAVAAAVVVVAVAVSARSTASRTMNIPAGGC